MNNDNLTNKVMTILGAGFILAVVGIIALAVVGKPIPDVLPLIVSSVIAGALGLLAPRPNSTQDVNVVNDRHDPVPVDPRA